MNDWNGWLNGMKRWNKALEMLLVATRANTENIGKVVEVSNRDAKAIRSLARIVEIHENA